MKILFIATGKTDAPYLLEAIGLYCKRLEHYLPFDMLAIPAARQVKNLPESRQKEKEGEQIVKALEAGDYVVLLDEKGNEYTSLQFAAYMEKKMSAAPRRLVFVAGGPYGFSDAVYRHAAEKISLSKMTFSHQMIRLLFVEQLYRAMTILHNEPYHHE
ncbi:MAG: 23S rRNA (pseudouridine(1915)-N(3))-methyltransferase RlmH [Tannerellaceae bacterium]|jgi:23S rRNA (pseudouridine1915-N3)-methyltransferase|nr:23S rRNA (pseudouridine(1915)-N(3))-methyltransferase RlmH [Tannerellaceae bacterium]